MLRIDSEEGLRSKDMWGKEGFLKKPKEDTVIFRLTKKHIKYDKVNEKSVAPRSFFVLAKSEFIVPNSNEGKFEGETEITFYTKIDKRDNSVTFIPQYSTEFSGRGDLTLDVNRNSDLVFFLMHHPRCATSPFKDDKKSPFFYLEDKKKDAKINLSIQALKLEAQSMVIKDEPEGLGEAKLRVLGGSYNIPNSDTVDIEVLKESLYVFATNKPKDFIESVSSPTTAKLAVIQKAIDMGIIRYSPEKTAWEGMEGSEVVSEICKVSLGAKPKDRLLKTVTITKPEIFEELKALTEM
jgi:hypothetical protein